MDEGVGVCVYYFFCYEWCFDGGGCFGWVEGVFVVLGYEGGFVYILGVEDDDFGFEGGWYFLVMVLFCVFFGWLFWYDYLVLLRLGKVGLW